jgi:hypothetical protein
VAERRSTPFQALNDLELVLKHPSAANQGRARELTIVSDGGWDHNPRNSEVRLVLTVEHLTNKRNYTMACVRAASLSSLNEAERVNGVETRSVQKAKLRQAVMQPSDSSLPAPEMLTVRRRRFQTAISNAISGATYSGRPVVSLMSHQDVPDSDRYSQEFRMHCRTVLDGKPQDVPLNVRLGITNALRYQELHSAAGFFDFQLRRTACVHKLKRLCNPADYPSAPDFMACSDLPEADASICPFQHDPVYTEEGSFMSDADVEAERQKKMFLW